LLENGAVDYLIFSPFLAGEGVSPTTGLPPQHVQPSYSPFYALSKQLAGSWELVTRLDLIPHQAVYIYKNR
jgi:hypothetical protein